MFWLILFIIHFVAFLIFVTWQYISDKKFLKEEMDKRNGRYIRKNNNDLSKEKTNFQRRFDNGRLGRQS